jgi:Type II secretory pathway, ATPase PulE/Tfp pilus assembly pathway, ATPase PilB
MEQETMTPEKNERKGVLSRIRDRLMGSVSKNKPEETKASAELDMLLSTRREDDFKLDDAFDRELEETLIASVEADLAVNLSEKVEPTFDESFMVSEENKQALVSAEESSAAEATPEVESLLAASDEGVPEDADTVESATEEVSSTVRPSRFGQTSQFRRGKSIRHHRLGQHLIDKGLITPQVLYAASKEQEVTGEKLGQILVQNQYLSNSERVQAILEVSAERIAQETVSKTKIPVDLLVEHKIIISTIHDDGIFVATRGDERMVRRIVAEYYPGKNITFVPFSPTKFAPFIANMRKSSDSEETVSTKETILERLIYRAVSGGGSDLHFIPRGKSYGVYLRINGILEHEHEGPLDEFLAVAAQAKNRAKLDSSKKHAPQNGSFQIEFNRKMVDLRVSATPNIEGECIVIRIQDPESINKNINRLGITHLDKWMKATSRRGGLCLLTGGTGTGKTTTMYSTILNFDRQSKKIITIENPVEVRIAGVSQVAVNEAVGFDFNKALEAQLTQDPDVIAVGEVKSEETARTIVRAATSGHLVLGTLHTGSISETLDRLIGLGIKDHELRYILRGIMSQDLIRTVCKRCNGACVEENGLTCAECFGEGYDGRTLVSEVEYFHDHNDVDHLFAVRDGREQPTWETIVEDAVNKYRQGVTTEHELYRLFGAAARPLLEKAA